MTMGPPLRICIAMGDNALALSQVVAVGCLLLDIGISIAMGVVHHITKQPVHVQGVQQDHAPLAQGNKAQQALDVILVKIRSSSMDQVCIVPTVLLAKLRQASNRRV